MRVGSKLGRRANRAAISNGHTQVMLNASDTLFTPYVTGSKRQNELSSSLRTLHSAEIFCEPESFFFKFKSFY